MLVLSRKPGEKIRIGDDIIVTVVEVRGNRVRIGIEAPEDCGIVRGELLEMEWPLENKKLPGTVDLLPSP